MNSICLNILLMTFLFLPTHMNGQHHLNIVSDEGGEYGQSMGYICMADSHNIYVMGDFIDSARTKVFPYFTTFDYMGNRVYSDTFRESIYNEEFILKKSKPIIKKGTLYYYNALRYINDSLYNYILEIDLSRGKIKRSVVLKSHKYGLVNFMHFDQSNTITLVTYVGAKGPDITSNKVHIVEIDTNFIVKKHLQFADTTIIGDYIEKTSLSNYIIIGFEHFKYNANRPIFYMVKDSNGTTIDYQLHEFDGKVSFGRDAAVFTVDRDKNNNWVIAFFHAKKKKPSDRYQFNEFPYVMSYTENFDSLLWETPMLRPHNYKIPRIDISAMSKAYDDSGFVVGGALSFFKNGNSYGEGLAFKVSNEGDSLWARSYVSSAYDVPDSVFFWDLKGMTATPYGYAMTGAISDFHLQKLRSFLLHVDKEGCLIPGCDDTVNTADIVEGNEKSFVIYPNPVGDQMYILSRISSRDRHAIIFYDMNGREVHKSYIVPDIGGQYIVFLPSSFIAGLYVMNIVDGEGKIVFSDKVVKE